MGLKDKDFEEYCNKVDKMYIDELRTESLKMAQSIIKSDPLNGHRKCAKSPKLQYVNNKIKNNGFKG